MNESGPPRSSLEFLQTTLNYQELLRTIRNYCGTHYEFLGIARKSYGIPKNYYELLEVPKKYHKFLHSLHLVASCADSQSAPLSQ